MIYLDEKIANQLQLISYPLEIIGFLLTFLEIFFYKSSLKLESWIDRKEKLYKTSPNAINYIFRKWLDYISDYYIFDSCNAPWFIFKPVALICFLFFLLASFFNSNNIIDGIISSIILSLIFSLFAIFSFLFTCGFFKVLVDNTNDISRFLAPIVTGVIIYIVNFTTLLEKADSKAIFLIKFSELVISNEIHATLLSIMVLIPVYIIQVMVAIILVYFCIVVLLAIIIYIIFGMISYFIKLLNLISNGRALGSLGLLLAFTGVIFNTYQVLVIMLL